MVQQHHKLTLMKKLLLAVCFEIEIFSVIFKIMLSCDYMGCFKNLPLLTVLL